MLVKKDYYYFFLSQVFGLCLCLNEIFLFVKSLRNFNASEIVEESDTRKLFKICIFYASSFGNLKNVRHFNQKSFLNLITWLLLKFFLSCTFFYRRISLWKQEFHLQLYTAWGMFILRPFSKNIYFTTRVHDFNTLSSGD